jgi:hypothetical protein
MSNEITPNDNSAPDNAAPKETNKKIDRRTLGARVGRFLLYTAPAVIVLTTAKQAQASP